MDIFSYKLLMFLLSSPEKLMKEQASAKIDLQLAVNWLKLNKNSWFVFMCM